MLLRGERRRATLGLHPKTVEVAAATWQGVWKAAARLQPSGCCKAGARASERLVAPAFAARFRGAAGTPLPRLVSVPGWVVGGAAPLRVVAQDLESRVPRALGAS